MNFDLRSGRAQSRNASARGRPDNSLLTNMRRGLERTLHDLHAIAFDDVALAHVLVVLECHAAFLAGDNFARVVLEALELRQLAFVDHDVVADQAYVRAALDGSVGDAAARDVADLRDLEDFQDFRGAER